MTANVLSRAGGGTVGVVANVLETFEKYRQMACSDMEGGGVLIGRRIKGSSDVVIDLATQPDSTDVRSRFSYTRQPEPAQRIVDRAWKTSRGTLCYLGEWHTHPEDSPSPSVTDRNNWRRIVFETVFEGDYLLFAIVGRDVIRFWEVTASLEILQLNGHLHCSRNRRL